MDKIFEELKRYADAVYRNYSPEDTKFHDLIKCLENIEVDRCERIRKLEFRIERLESELSIPSSL